MADNEQELLSKEDSGEMEKACRDGARAYQERLNRISGIDMRGKAYIDEFMEYILVAVAKAQVAKLKRIWREKGYDIK